MDKPSIKQIVIDILECSSGKKQWPESYFQGSVFYTAGEVLKYLRDNSMLEKFIDSEERKKAAADDTFLLREKNGKYDVYRVYSRERGVVQVAFESKDLEEVIRYKLQFFSFLSSD